MSPDEEFCSVCVHRTHMGRSIGCLYLTDTGKPRGCHSGRSCTEREIGPTFNRSKIYSVVDPEVRKKQKEEHAKRSEMIGYKEEALKRMRLKEK